MSISEIERALEDQEELDALKARIADLEGVARSLAGTKLLLSKEVGQILGLHPKTVEKWTRLKGNPLPCIRRGRTLRFQLSDVNRWVAQRKEG
jgi:excisionase family DNA binding protein